MIMPFSPNTFFDTQMNFMFFSDSSFGSVIQDVGAETVTPNSQMQPFEMDLDVHSNRSSIISQVSRPILT